MKLQRPRRHWMRPPAGVAALILAALAGAQPQIRLVKPVFPGVEPGQIGAPMIVEVENKGADARGILRVSSGEFQMDYPVELPQGSAKQVFTYPEAGHTSPSIGFSLVTNRGRSFIQIDSSYGAGLHAASVALISDAAGGLTFLRQQASTNGIPFNPTYAKPEEAPDRPVGYQALRAVVLAEGAERIPAPAAQAIQQWALSGGTVVFLGGAAAPILNDPDWAPMIPVRNAAPKNLTSSSALAKRYGAPTGAFAATVGEPAPGATSRADGLIVERPFGLGRAVYLAFNPFERPLDTWSGRPRLFVEIFNPGFWSLPDAVLASVRGEDPENPYGGRRYHMYYGTDELQASNPFRTKLPDTATVLWILTAYFVAVVPVNFLVLRKLKRGELAWGSAPVLSLAFAGVFFYAARDLYSARMSTSTQAILLAQEGHPQGMLVGHTQMFFPQGGRHDLKLRGVDSLAVRISEPYMRWRGNERNLVTLADLEPVDLGEIAVPAMGTSNLSFREVFYRQRLEGTLWTSIDSVKGGVKVTNRCPFNLENAKVAFPDGIVHLGSLPPGESRVARAAQALQAVGSTPLDIGRTVVKLARRSGVPLLIARVSGMRTGPQIGVEVEGSRGVTLVCAGDERVASEPVKRHARSYAEW